MNKSGPPPPPAALFVALLGPPIIALLAKRLDGGLTTGIALQLLYLSLVAFVIFIGPLKVRRPDWITFAFGLALAAIVLFFPAPPAPPEAIRSLALQPLWFRIVLGLTGGAAEEILYRGYALERLAAWTGKLWLGASLSAIAFGLAHAPIWGLRYALIADLPFGIVMTLFYLWRRDLVANILAHSTGLVIAVVTVS